MWKDFAVAKDALILQDNIKTKLADLKKGDRITLNLKGKSAVSIIADGGTVGGPIRYVSANEERNSVTVIAGRKDEKRIYHLVKQTEVMTDSGKVVRVKDLKEGTMLLLTLSVEDTNTVIQIQTIAPER